MINITGKGYIQLDHATQGMVILTFASDPTEESVGVTLTLEIEAEKATDLIDHDLVVFSGELVSDGHVKAKQIEQVVK